jgi:hypothetical protein
MDTTLRPHDQVVYTEFDGTEAVLVDLVTKRYYTLNETAMLVWLGLEKGLSKAELAESLMEVYEVEPDHATASVERLLTSLAAHRLLNN